MSIKFFKGLALLPIIALLAFINSEPPITVYLIGDSTVCDYPLSRSPLTGWGMPFATFFDTSVVVKNHAKGGRSTRTFLEENRWEPIMDNLKPGDYVFIQFGHNDEAKEEKYKDRYTSPEDYRKNLIRFISDIRSKNAIPILVTPVTRMNFINGIAQETHQEYSAIVRDLAVKQQCVLVDLDAESLKLLQAFGPDKAKLLYMQLAPNEHPHYPKGISDFTHFSEFGARKMAEIVWSALKNQHIDLVKHINSAKK